jgi:hypothetical protein
MKKRISHQKRAGKRQKFEAKMETPKIFPSQLIVIAAFALIIAAIYTVSSSSNEVMPPFPNPQGRYCDANTPCPTSEGYECYKFSADPTAVCFKGNPCLVCASKNCTGYGRYPTRIECQNQSIASPQVK